MDLKTDKTKVIIFSYAQSLLEAKKNQEYVICFILRDGLNFVTLHELNPPVEAELKRRRDDNGQTKIFQHGQR